MIIIEKGKLPAKWSAQCGEIHALLRGLQWLNHKRGTIYTDSKYAYGVVHTLGKIWTERGFVNSKGKTLTHESLIKEVLEALKGPLEGAVVHVRGHQKGNSLEIRGNNLADQVAKKAAMDDSERVLHLADLSDNDKDNKEIPIFSEKTRRVTET